MRYVQAELGGIMVTLTGQVCNEENVRLYRKLIKEEYHEWLDEVRGVSSNYSEANEYKELSDLLWVILQYANQKGWCMESGITALAEEYISKFYDAEGKFNPLFSPEGKLLKNNGFKKANFEQVLTDTQEDYIKTMTEAIEFCLTKVPSDAVGSKLESC